MKFCVLSSSAFAKVEVEIQCNFHMRLRNCYQCCCEMILHDAVRYSRVSILALFNIYYAGYITLATCMIGRVFTIAEPSQQRRGSTESSWTVWVLLYKRSVLAIGSEELCYVLTNAVCDYYGAEHRLLLPGCTVPYCTVHVLYMCCICAVLQSQPMVLKICHILLSQVLSNQTTEGFVSIICRSGVLYIREREDIIQYRRIPFNLTRLER